MGDADDDGIPAWQRTSSETNSITSSDAEVATPTTATETSNETVDDNLTIAQRFLKDPKVENEPRHKKIAFLKSKGVKEEHIQQLLGEPHKTLNEETASITDTAARNEPEVSAPAAAAAAPSRPPIVTYPEFLAKPQRAPPLVTMQGLLATLYGFAGLSSLVYGANRLILEPMVESLNGARQELHDTVAAKLDELVTQLERTASTVPPRTDKLAPKRTTRPEGEVDADSDEEDPAEMFHRDVGTQTAPSDARNSPVLDAKTPEPHPPVVRNTISLVKLAKCVSGLRDAVVSQSGDLEDIRDQSEHFREELDRIIYPQIDFTPGSYGARPTVGSKDLPEDEARKARDNIRRIKGLLLSTRTFPASTR